MQLPVRGWLHYATHGCPAPPHRGCSTTTFCSTRNTFCALQLPAFLRHRTRSYGSCVTVTHTTPFARLLRYAYRYGCRYGYGLVRWLDYARLLPFCHPFLYRYAVLLRCGSRGYVRLRCGYYFARFTTHTTRLYGFCLPLRLLPAVGWVTARGLRTTTFCRYGAARLRYTHGCTFTRTFRLVHRCVARLPLRLRLFPVPRLYVLGYRYAFTPSVYGYVYRCRAATVCLRCLRFADIRPLRVCPVRLPLIGSSYRLPDYRMDSDSPVTFCVYVRFIYVCYNTHVYAFATLVAHVYTRLLLRLWLVYGSAVGYAVVRFTAFPTRIYGYRLRGSGYVCSLVRLRVYRTVAILRLHVAHGLRVARWFTVTRFTIRFAHHTHGCTTAFPAYWFTLHAPGLTRFAFATLRLRGYATHGLRFAHRRIHTHAFLVGCLVALPRVAVYTHTFAVTRLPLLVMRSFRAGSRLHTVHTLPHHTTVCLPVPLPACRLHTFGYLVVRPVCSLPTRYVLLYHTAFTFLRLQLPFFTVVTPVVDAHSRYGCVLRLHRTPVVRCVCCLRGLRFTAVTLPLVYFRYTHTWLPAVLLHTFSCTVVHRLVTFVPVAFFTRRGCHTVVAYAAVYLVVTFAYTPATHCHTARGCGSTVYGLPVLRAHLPTVAWLVTTPGCCHGCG